MKRYYILLSFLFLFIIVDGQVNLGTVYFQNPQYLVSFDKVIYPGYKIALENFTVREYLMNTKISEKVLSKKIEGPYSEGMALSIDTLVGNWNLSAYISLNEKFEIDQETYYLDRYTGLGLELSLSPDSSKVNVFIRARNKQVEEVEILNKFDTETNKVSSVEIIKNTRPMTSNEVADMDGNIYRTVKIGEQRWMAENLRSTSFSNGDSIPFLNESQWGNTASSGLIEVNLEGNYYNFYTMVDRRNVCPAGFYIPESRDIEYLYNAISTYGGKTKITPQGVKKRVYPRLLAPVIAPISIAANVALYSASVAVDLAYTVPWVLIDGLILGPIFGWETVKEQKRKAMVDSLAQFKLKYTPFPTAKDNIAFYATEAVNDAVWLIPILPYRVVTNESYPRTGFTLRSESLRFKSKYHQPVLTFLLEKGEEEVLSDPFGFSLNFDNNIKLPKSIKYNIKSLLTGVTYYERGYPQVWGLNEKANHELRCLSSESGGMDEKMSTRIRCVTYEK